MNDCPCPICSVEMIPFSLLENDPEREIVFCEAKLEDGLGPHGFRCANCHHEFGFVGEQMVLIEPEFSKEHVDHPNPSRLEAFVDAVATLVSRWCSPNLARSIQDRLTVLTPVPWSKVKAWHVAYDHHQPDWSEEIDEVVLAGMLDEARIDAYANPLEEEGRFFYPEPDDDWDYRPYSPHEDDADTYTSNPLPDEADMDLEARRARVLRRDEDCALSLETTKTPFEQPPRTGPDHRGEE